MKSAEITAVLMAPAAGLLLVIAACQPARPSPPPAPTVVNTGCTVFGRIQVPKEDQTVISVALLERIHQHNLAYDAQCSKKK